MNLDYQIIAANKKMKKLSENFKDKWKKSNT